MNEALFCRPDGANVFYNALLQGFRVASPPAYYLSPLTGLRECLWGKVEFG